ncbi:MAG: hypothetical protein ACR2JY_16200 [Chloroflexota bacterium]
MRHAEQQGDGQAMAGSCGPASATADSAAVAAHPASVPEVRAQLAELQQRQEALARQIAQLEEEPIRSGNVGQ